MTEIRFYHLERTGLERALPVMLERTLARGDRAVVRAGSAERVSSLNAHLWTHDDRGFLPHGAKEDGYAPDQPIWLTTEDECPNDARVLFLCDGTMAERLDAYALVVLLFDGRDEAALADARGQWKRLRDEGHKLTYWQQTDQGWKQMAET